jgi:hypothetical protein
MMQATLGLPDFYALAPLFVFELPYILLGGTLRAHLHERASGGLTIAVTLDERAAPGGRDDFGRWARSRPPRWLEAHTRNADSRHV